MTQGRIAEFDDDLWLLVQGGRVVGTVGIDAPEGATGQRVFTEEPSAEAKAPLFGAPTAHLRTHFQAGSEPGEYVVTFQLIDGNSSQRVVTVSE